MEQAIRKVARSCQNQQAFGIEIKPADGEPLANLQMRKSGKYIGTTTWIIMTDDFTSGFVIKNHARRFTSIGTCDGLAIHTHSVIFTDTLSDMRRLAIDRHTSRNNELFHFTT
jgi:hypothetical protein